MSKTPETPPPAETYFPKEAPIPQETPATHIMPSEIVIDGGGEPDPDLPPIADAKRLGRAFTAWLKQQKIDQAPGTKIVTSGPEWRNRSVTMPDGWWGDTASGWTFSVFAGRLVTAVKDQPPADA